MSAGVATADVPHLRAQMERLQGRRLTAPVLPVPPTLEPLLPDGGLRPGAVYEIGGSASLLLALLAGPTRDGSWCAVVGMPELGAEAAEQWGVDLARLVMIPDPGGRWLAVTATVADVLPVVAVRVGGRVSGAESARLAARLRERGTVLLAQGAWPQAEASLRVESREWTGLGRGHGHLRGCMATVASSSRRWGAPRRVRMPLPGDGLDERDEGASRGVGGTGPVGSVWQRAPMRAVG